MNGARTSPTSAAWAWPRWGFSSRNGVELHPFVLLPWGDELGDAARGDVKDHGTVAHGDAFAAELLQL
jgi:hypothetical protein